jgi:DNA gyrase subunit B
MTAFSDETLIQRFREMAFLTKGIWLTFVDERNDYTITYYFEGGIKSFVQRLNKDRKGLHDPFYFEKVTIGRG